MSGERLLGYQNVSVGASKFRMDDLGRERSVFFAAWIFSVSLPEFLMREHLFPLSSQEIFQRNNLLASHQQTTLESSKFSTEKKLALQEISIERTAF